MLRNLHEGAEEQKEQDQIHGNLSKSAAAPIASTGAALPFAEAAQRSEDANESQSGNAELHDTASGSFSDSSSDDVLVLIDPIRETASNAASIKQADASVSAGQVIHWVEQEPSNNETEEVTLPVQRQSLQDGVESCSRQDAPAKSTTGTRGQEDVMSPSTRTPGEANSHCAARRASPRTATRDLFNMDLDTGLKIGKAEDIVECERQRSVKNIPLHDESSTLSPERMGTDQSCCTQGLDSTGALSKASILRGQEERGGKGIHLQNPQRSVSNVRERRPPNAAGAKNRLFKTSQHISGFGGSAWAAKMGTLQGCAHQYTDMPVDPLRGGNLRSQGYSPVVNRLMARAEVSVLNDEISHLRAQNRHLMKEVQNLNTERRALIAHIEHQRTEGKERQYALLAQLDESVQVSYVLRTELAASHEQLAAIQQLADMTEARSQRVKDKSQQVQSTQTDHLTPGVQDAGAAHQRLADENRDMSERLRRLEEENKRLSQSLVSSSAVLQMYLKRNEDQGANC
jgi:hypothetical protein